MSRFAGYNIVLALRTDNWLANIEFQDTTLLIFTILALFLNEKAESFVHPVSDTEAYMFGYGINSNENYEKQNFGQQEYRNEDKVVGEWYVKYLVIENCK